MKKKDFKGMEEQKKDKRWNIISSKQKAICQSP